MSTTTTAEASGFVHAALLYGCEQQYLDQVLPFILDGLALGQPVLVGVPTRNLAMLRGALGDAAANVAMADMTEIGRNPARMLGVMDGFATEHRDRRVRIVGEPVWPGRSVDEYAVCVESEALCNLLFDGCEMTALCPYDTSRLADRALADARMTHPLLWQSGSTDRCAEFAPHDALTRHHRPLVRDAMAVSYTVRAHADLGSARTFAAHYARQFGLSRERLESLLLIVTELASNSLQHAGQPCQLAFWPSHGHLVCEASDRGCLDDPLAGRRLPSGDGPGGRGLFLVNAVADLVRMYAAPTGTTIRAYLRLGFP
ncbi:anti-sigma factor RsbA family regulatory protein [Mycobacterium botniense]|uniref:Anti-sigma regulatory factor n=1 Tax=Mycobacterium botniense TaxID=84962 RepID=A0A7I9Y3U6_9MYCO|nr:anti-sigma factor RsbA family regulatory protein [Mycobacterium botniense]GFG76694.1 anti-sigma regulatory factor [Mycobacterium botniense]